LSCSNATRLLKKSKKEVRETHKTIGQLRRRPLTRRVGNDGGAGRGAHYEVMQDKGVARRAGDAC
jgi:hypothetical protein